MEKKDVKAGVVQTVEMLSVLRQNGRSVGVPCMLLLAVYVPFFLQACGVPLHGRSSGPLLPHHRHRVDRQSLPQGGQLVVVVVAVVVVVLDLVCSFLLHRLQKKYRDRVASLLLRRTVSTSWSTSSASSSRCG